MLIKIKKSRLIRLFHNNFLRPYWKYDFLEKMKPGEKLLDVGCGNDSPYRYKTMFPQIHYTGLDVGDYNQKHPILADEYIVCQPADFASEISKRENSFDFILSSHNLEHCLDREETLNAMMSALRPGGRIYLAFPSEASTSFPRRGGTLNYFDDKTHLGTPPNFNKIINHFKDSGFRIDFNDSQYRPQPLRTIGRFLEKNSIVKNHVLMGTWEYYGFESIIWATKPPN
jgi:SAM-dependent methyltransferase